MFNNIPGFGSNASISPNYPKTNVTLPEVMRWYKDYHGDIDQNDIDSRMSAALYYITKMWTVIEDPKRYFYSCLAGSNPHTTTAYTIEYLISKYNK